MTTSFDELAQRGKGITRGQRGVVKRHGQQPVEDGPAPRVVTSPQHGVAGARDSAMPEDMIPASPTPTQKVTRTQPPAVRAGETTTAIGLRLRKTIDNGLADRIHALRVQLDRRVTKTELLEMLAWEAGAATVEDLAERVDRYRKRAPRRE